jgi:hypothetical protein
MNRQQKELIELIKTHGTIPIYKCKVVYASPISLKNVLEHFQLKGLIKIDGGKVTYTGE